jgi:hypothetical protein
MLGLKIKRDIEINERDVFAALAAERRAKAALTVLALAVLYDRDEQISQAFDLVLRAQGALDGAYAERFEAGLALAPPVPAAELHYHRAFLYETAGFAHEARAEWLAYLRLGTGRGLVRARAHLAALDAFVRDRRPSRGTRE